MYGYDVDTLLLVLGWYGMRPSLLARAATVNDRDSVVVVATIMMMMKMAC